MTEDTDTTGDEEPTAETTSADERATPAPGEQADDAGRGTASPDGGGDEAAATEPDDGTDVREYLLKGALVMLVVLGVVATLQFYLSAQTAISRLASSEYRPLFVAGFNLVVLLAVGVGIAQVVRRLG